MNITGYIVTAEYDDDEEIGAWPFATLTRARNFAEALVEEGGKVKIWRYEDGELTEVPQTDTVVYTITVEFDRNINQAKWTEVSEQLVKAASYNNTVLSVDTDHGKLQY